MKSRHVKELEREQRLRLTQSQLFEMRAVRAAEDVVTGRWPASSDVYVRTVDRGEPLKSAVLQVVPGHARENRAALDLRSSTVDLARSELGAESEQDLEFELVFRLSSKRNSQAVSLGEDGYAMNWVDLELSDELGDVSIGIEVLCRARSSQSREKFSVGFVTVTGPEILEESQGVLTRALIMPSRNAQGSPIDVAGTLTLDYLLITPHPTAIKYSSARNEVKTSRLVGHRGSGGHGTHHLQENTLLSFVSATQLAGVSHVELDVQLTRDGVPVIYHDFLVKVPGRVGHAPVHSLSYSEWKQLRISSNQATAERSCPRHRSGSKTDADISTRALQQSTSAHGGVVSKGFETVMHDQFPSLSSVLSKLSADIGLLIELKYPTEEFQHEMRLPYPSRNDLVDATLQRVFDSLASADNDMTANCTAAPRSIAFLSFDADLCVLLRMKQSQFPVFFLNSEVREHLNDMKDPRTVSLQRAFAFAQSARFDGMVLLADMVLENVSVVDKIRSAGLKLLTYGKANSIAENVRTQLEAGLDAVIADNVGALAREIYEKKLLPSEVVSGWSIRSVSSMDSFSSIITNSDDAEELQALSDRMHSLRARVR
mmetsp:Transcript_13155/g.28569  ORF Transcript_13155/g.28569 Transcript_13155/m.28569 type:complete len:600 (+) Transcript_13155:74-1873(+)